MGESALIRGFRGWIEGIYVVGTAEGNTREYWIERVNL
jgi:hypothetical protein